MHWLNCIIHICTYYTALVILQLLVYCIHTVRTYTCRAAHRGVCIPTIAPCNEGWLAGLLTVPNLVKHFSIYRLFSYSAHQLLIHLLIGEVGGMKYCVLYGWPQGYQGMYILRKCNLLRECQQVELMHTHVHTCSSTYAHPVHLYPIPLLQAVSWCDWCKNERHLQQ